MIIPELINARPSSSYVGAPIQELKDLGNTLQTRFENNRASLGKFETVLDNIDVRNVNRHAVNKAVSEFKSRIGEFVDKGDFENQGNDLFNLARDFQGNQTIGNAVKDKQQYTAWKDGIETMYKDGKIDKATYDNTLEYSSVRNNKSIEIDPETGEVNNIFSGYTPAEYQDIGNAMFEKAKGWQTDEKPVTVTYTDGKGKEVESQIIYDPKSKGFVFTGTNERVSEGELKSALTMSVMSDPKYMSYINQNLMFQKEKLMRGREIQEVRESDVLKVMGIEQEELKQQVEDAGYNYDTMVADPEMRESLYDIFYRKKAVNDYVSPAVAKEGFSKTKTKLYDNKVYLEQLQHAHNLKLQKQKASDEQDLEILKNQLEKPVAKSYINSQPGSLIDSPFEITKFPERIKTIDQSIDKMEGKRSRGEVDHLAATQEIEALKREKAVLSGYNKMSKDQYLESPEGIKFLETEYNNYKKIANRANRPIKSKESYREYLMDNHRDFDIFGTDLSKVSPADKQAALRSQNKLLSNIEDYQKMTGNTQSSFANVLSGSGDTSGTDSNEVDVFSKGLNISLNEHSKNFLAWTPTGMKDFNAIKSGYDAEKMEVKAGYYDAPIYGTWYYQANVVDKSNGKVLDTYSVMPKDQNTAQQEYWDLNQSILQNRGENDAMGLQAKKTLAHIKFPSLDTRELTTELAGVDQDTDPNIVDFSSVKRVSGKNVVISKNNIEYPVFKDGVKVPGEYQKRLTYQLIEVDDDIEEGTEVNSESIKNIIKIDKQGKVTQLRNPQMLNNKEAIERGMINDFFSIDDIKLTLFDKIK